MAKYGSVLLTIAAVATLGGCGAIEGARESAKKAQSASNAKQILLGIYVFQESNDGAWPESLDDLKDNGIPDAEWDTIMTNPATGDNPGYEYVKPEERAARSTTVVLYQLRNGQRDMALPVGYGDASVREP